MPGLSKKETARLLTHVEAQGVVVTNVKNGYLLRLPNGETTTIHLTESDHRGPLNLRATLKRAGVDWPTDHKDIKPMKSTLEHGEHVLKRMGYPNSLRMRDFMTAALIDDWKVTHTTVSKFLYYRGYEAVGNTVNRRFIIPDELIEATPAPIVQISPEPLEEVVEKVSTLEVREFLDSHDSWTVETDILPDTLTVKDMKLMFSAMGLKYEVRIWK